MARSRNGDAVSRAGRQAGVSRVGCLLSILVLILVGYAAVEFIGNEISYRGLAHQVQESARAAHETPDAGLAQQIREKAAELGLPASAGNATIRRLAGNRISITVQYPDTVTFFGRFHIVRGRRVDVEMGY